MREIAAVKIKDTVAALFESAAYDLPSEVEAAIDHALAHETSPIARHILSEIVKNAEIARKEKLPLCQDTGTANIFVELGQDVRIIDGDLIESINEGVSIAYKDLRKSLVSSPFHRVNTNDNTPAKMNIEIVAGDKIKIIVMPKGGGAENCSFVQMMLPTSSPAEVEDFIVQKIKENGAKACPPIIVGVGIGGTFDFVALLAKKALLRPLSSHSTKDYLADMEKSLLKKINNLGIGPMGVGGQNTALAVHVIEAPCHIASLPVAVNIQCHSHRHKEAVI